MDCGHASPYIIFFLHSICLAHKLSFCMCTEIGTFNKSIGCMRFYKIRFAIGFLITELQKAMVNREGKKESENKKNEQSKCEMQ